MSQTSHYYSHNHGDRGILFTSSGDTFCVDGRVLHSSQTMHYSPQRVDIRGDGAIRGIRSEEMNHSSLLHFG